MLSSDKLPSFQIVEELSPNKFDRQHRFDARRTLRLSLIFIFLLACVGFAFSVEAQVNVVSVTATQPIAGATPGVFVIKRTGDTNQPLSVPFSLSGTATQNVDYTADAPASAVLPAAFAPGKVAQAFSLDGQGQYVQGPDDPQLDLTEEATIDVWVFFNQLPSASGRQAVMIADKSAFGSDFLLDAEPDNRFHFSVGTGRKVASATVIQTGRWYHVAATYKALTEVKIYVNGVIENTLAIDQRRGASTGTPFAIGRTLGLAFLIGPSYFNGLIDEVHLFNRVLSEAEIRSIFTADSAGLCKSAGATPNCIQPPAGLVGWFTGDNDARNIAENIFSPGKVGQAFTFNAIGTQFNGTGEYVQYPSAIQDPTSEATVDAWVYFNVLPSEKGFMTIISKSSLNNGVLELLAFPDDKIRFFSAFDSVSTNTVVQKGRWYHIAATFKAGVGMRMYVNGVLENTQPNSSGRTQNDSPLTIGNSSLDPTRIFNGLIDEAQMYNRALSTAEIQAIYNADSAGLCKPIAVANCVKPPAGLIGWWTGDGNTRDLVTGARGALVGYDNRLSGQQLTFAAGQTSITVNIRSVFVGDRLDFTRGAGKNVVLTLFPDPQKNLYVDALKGSAIVYLSGLTASTELSLSEISPNRGGNAGSVTTVISGQGFKSGVTVKLVRAGQPDIVATQTNPAADETSVAATFDLKGKPQGVYDVVVANAIGNPKTLAGAFTIEGASSASLYASVLSRSVIRIGSENNFYVLYGNGGNTDITNAPLWIGVPNYVSITPDTNFPFEVVPIGDSTYIKVKVPIVRANSDGSPDVLVIKVKVADANNVHRIFRMTALIFNPQFTSQSGGTTASANKDSFIEPAGSGDRPYDSNPFPANPTLKDCGNLFGNGDTGVKGGFDEISLIGDIAVTGGATYVKCQKLLDDLDPEKEFDKLFPKGNKGGVSGGKGSRSDPRTPNDPNEKAGAGGVGTAGYITGKDALPYAIYFENEATAGLPAQDVTVTDQIDPAKIDLSTFSFGAISFGTLRFTPPAGQRSFTSIVDLRPNKNLLVKITASINTTSGLVSWTFNSLDPSTGRPPDDPQAGFLPQNRTSPEGQASVTFMAMPKTTLATNAVINNQARIVFDVNAPIDTGVVTNTIDKTAPTSTVRALPSSAPYSFVINWAGTDQGSGINFYTISVSDNGANYTTFLTTSDTSGVFTGQAGHTYKFYSVATDQVGNTEATKTNAEAMTTVNVGSGNAIDEATFFVSQHYRDFLSRTPDASGFNFWVNQIASCQGNAQCIDIKRQNVSAAYFLSREFQETGFYVIKLQRATFGKISQDATKRISYQQFLSDAQAVGSGFVDGQTGADTILDQNKTSYAQGVVTSSDFTTKYPTSLSAAQLVDALFQTAGVAPQGTERQDAITAYGAGGTTGRAAALRKVAESNSIKNAEFSPAFVLLQYFGYLRRNPTDAPDNNDSGYQFWLNKLNQFGGDYIRSEMVRSFILSTEYRKRFGNP